MSEEECVYWLVPFAGEFVPRRRVPPVFVELAIRESDEDVYERDIIIFEHATYRESSANPLQMHSILPNVREVECDT